MTSTHLKLGHKDVVAMHNVHVSYGDVKMRRTDLLVLSAYPEVPVEACVTRTETREVHLVRLDLMIYASNDLLVIVRVNNSTGSFPINHSTR